eukprot:COSAG01_NODE_1913_length_8922_cov_30.042049_6_plen_166_part_00
MVCKAWKQFVAVQHRCRYIICHLQRRRLLQFACRLFRDWGAAVLHPKVQLRRAVARLCNQHTGRALKAWEAKVKELWAVRMKMQRWMNRSVSTAFSGWAECTEAIVAERAYQQAKFAQVLARLGHVSRRYTFAVWKKKVVDKQWVWHLPCSAARSLCGCTETLCI